MSPLRKTSPFRAACFVSYHDTSCKPYIHTFRRPTEDIISYKMFSINTGIALVRAILALPYMQRMLLDSMKGRRTVPLLSEHAIQALSMDSQPST